MHLDVIGHSDDDSARAPAESLALQARSLHSFYVFSRAI